MSRATFLRDGGAPLGEVCLELAPSGSAFTYVVRVRDQHGDIDIDVFSDHGGQIRVGGRVVPFRTFRRKDGVDVWLDGRVYSLKAAPRVPRRSGATGALAAGGDLVAPMPGTILKVNVASGDSFDAHDPLIVMESMKMEMSVSSPVPGCVSEVLCAPGDLVELGAMLVKLKEA